MTKLKIKNFEMDKKIRYLGKCLYCYYLMRFYIFKQKVEDNQTKSYHLLIKILLFQKMNLKKRIKIRIK